MKEEKNAVQIDEHLMSFEGIMKKHSTLFDADKPSSSKGLTQAEAETRFEKYGPNILTPPKKTHPFVLYLECVGQPFNVMLIICAVLTWALYGIDPIGNSRNTYIGGILFGVALINGYIEFYQHQKSAALLASFLNLIPAKCNVIREGVIQNKSASELVPGDVVLVRMGDKVPADLVVFKASDFKVDNSSLTGESEPQERHNKNTHGNPLEATNIAFNGTLAISGECYGVVIQTGDFTFLGQIASLTQGEEKRPSPMTEEIERFVKIISFFAVSSAVIFFIVAFFRGGQSSNTKRAGFALNFAIGVLVAWVPQGLPATVSMLLTIAAKRMSKKNVLVKDLKGVETLGAITLLATDKTGTLTRNQMTVSCLWVSLKLMVASTSQNPDDSELPFDASVSGVQEVIHVSSLCTKARFDDRELPLDMRTILGDATESGLYRFAAQRLQKDIDKIDETYPKVFEIPFNSENKWHMSIHKKLHDKGPLTLMMKGAPERVLRTCSSILISGQVIPLTAEHKEAFNIAYEQMAGKGHRVLAFAQKLLDKSDYPEDFVFDKESKNYPSTDLCFVGLTSLEDPPKHGVREAIGHCREAGIRVMMVTGDHPLTAEAIGRKINLMLSDTKEKIAKRTGRPLESIREDECYAIVIHGEKIDSLTDDDWDVIFSKEEIIFARTSPKHKLQIVKRAQALGHIVGVTGDGVNDSPALKKADLGIAMNISGSDVSKEAAAMILLDDNFASTVNGIAEGRLIFMNLKKSIQYVVTHIIPEVIPFLLNVVVPIPLGLDALQILAIDLGFELFAALSYAWELPENHIGMMKLPPRRPVTEKSINKRKARYELDKQLKLPLGPNGERPSLFDGIGHSIRMPFTKAYWKRAFEKPEGEILVDGNLLSWAYLEIGIIQTIGALTVFFIVLYNGINSRTGNRFGITPSDAVSLQDAGAFVDSTTVYTLGDGSMLTGSELFEAISQAQSSYYLGVMIMQMFNLFLSKCRYSLPIGNYPLLNKRTWFSVAGGVGFAMLIVYVPPINIPFVTSYHLSPLFWLIPLGFGVIMVLYACVRVVLRRIFSPMTLNPEIPNLQMYPTRWSTGRSNRSA